MADFSNDALIKGVKAGDVRSISRAISLIEDQSPRVQELQKNMFKGSKKARVIGITGPPGAGKSTLVDQLVGAYVDSGQKVGVLAVDPSSPYSGGAILGDRIRMVHSIQKEGVYIRSMATRGALGGLSAATFEAIQVLESACFDTIIVETVGVGQAEVDVVKSADTCVVVLVPGLGDGVQAIKAGILEIADLFVVNKSDREGADLLFKDLRMLLTLIDKEEADWNIPILKTVATKNTGISELVERIKEHGTWLESSGKGKEKQREIISFAFHKVLESKIMGAVLEDQGIELESLIDKCAARDLDLHSAARVVLDRLNLLNS